MGSKVDEIIKEKFLKALEDGKFAPWRSPYVGYKTAINRVTKRPYRGVNVFFLKGEYATYKQWKELGYRCEKGKSEIAFFNQRANYQRKDENGNPIFDKDGKPVLAQAWVSRLYFVWERHNVRDSNGEIAPSIWQGEIDPTPATELEEAAIGTLRDYCNRYDIEVREDYQNLAYYSPVGRFIHLPDYFKSNTDRVNAFAHECAHSTGAENLLNRRFGKDKSVYSYEELVAETASAIFCTEMGVAVDLDNTTAYLAGWAKWIRATAPKAIITALYQAQKAVRLLKGEPLEDVRKTADTKEAEPVGA